MDVEVRVVLFVDEHVRSAGRVLELPGTVVGLKGGLEAERQPERCCGPVVPGLHVEAFEPLCRHWRSLRVAELRSR